MPHVVTLWTENEVRAFGPFDQTQADVIVEEVRTATQFEAHVVKLESIDEATELILIINGVDK